MDVGIGRQEPGNVELDTLDGEVAAPAVDAHLDIKSGDWVRYRGSTGAIREGEVLDIIDERLVRMRRPAPTSENWGSLNGGVWPIKRTRIIEVVHHV
jgi:hypothetical protein